MSKPHKTKSHLYPANWSEIRSEILIRSDCRCECSGECGLHRTTGGPRRCCEMHGSKAKWAKGTVILTIAHLDYPGGPCDCEEQTGRKCGRMDHLKAMCQRCHLRIDTIRHMKNAAATRERKRANGTMELIPIA
jgi:hypothetical protein